MATRHTQEAGRPRTELRIGGKNKQHLKFEHQRVPFTARGHLTGHKHEIDFSVPNLKVESKILWCAQPVLPQCACAVRVSENRYTGIDSESSPQIIETILCSITSGDIFRNRFGAPGGSAWNVFQSVILIWKCHLLFLILIGETVGLVSLAPSVEKENTLLNNRHVNLHTFTIRIHTSI